MQELQKIIINIIKNPHIPKFYRDLSIYFDSQYNKKVEIDALKYLLETKFNENDSNNNKE